MNSICSGNGNLVQTPELIKDVNFLQILLRRHLANQLKEK